MFSAGDHVRYLPILVALLPVALQCVRDSNAEVAGMGRGTCLSSAAALTIRGAKGVNADEGSSGTTTGGVMRAVLSATSSESWRVRRGAAAVACVLQTRLHFVLEDTQHGAVDAALLSLLADARREVQETARLAVSTRVAHLTAAEARELCATFVAGADSAAASRKKRRKIAKRKAAAGEGVAVAAGEPSGAIQEQQKNVLGLSAVVLASPCDVPAWVPGALESLARHVNDESPGRLPVRQTVSEEITYMHVLRCASKCKPDVTASSELVDFREHLSSEGVCHLFFTFRTIKITRVFLRSLWCCRVAKSRGGWVGHGLPIRGL